MWLQRRLTRWVGGVRVLAAGVVGQREIDQASVRVDGAPFRAVHLGRAELVGGQAGVEQHIGLAHEAVAVRRLALVRRLRHQRAVAPLQRQPFARAVGVEAGHVQRALVEQCAAGAGLVVRLGADELVDVFIARVVAEITHHRLAFQRRVEHHALVREAAEMGTLDRHAGGVERIDFHHPAEGVGFVAVIQGGIAGLGAGIEADERVGAAVGLVPGIARGLVAIAMVDAGKEGGVPGHPVANSG